MKADRVAINRREVAMNPSLVAMNPELVSINPEGVSMNPDVVRLPVLASFEAAEHGGESLRVMFGAVSLQGSRSLGLGRFRQPV